MRQLVWLKYQAGNENRYQQINYQSCYQDNAKPHFAQNHSSEEVWLTQAAYVGEKKDKNPHSHLKTDQQGSDIEGIEDGEAYSVELYTEDYEQSNEVDEIKMNHIQVLNLSRTTCICCWCTFIFKFNNMLHKHLSTCKRKQSIKTALSKPYVSLEESVNEQVIKSFTRVTADTEYGYWFWHYVIAEAHINKMNNQSHEICMNTDCTMFLIDRKFLLSNILNILVKPMSFLIRVHELRSKIHSCSDFILLDLYLNSKVDSQVKSAHIYHEVHVIDNLNVKLLLDLNILKSEEIIIDLKKKCLIIHSCQDLKISIRITLKMEMWVLHTVHFKNRVIILSNSVTAILTGIQGAKSSADQDYLFELNQRQLTQKLSTSEGFYIHVVNCNLFFMQVHNVTELLVKIPQHSCLEFISEYEEEGCYLIAEDNHNLVINIFKAMSRMEKPHCQETEKVTLTELETKLSNQVTIYGEQGQVEILSQAVTAYSDLWIEKDTTVCISEEEYMSISLQNGWKKDKMMAWVYSLSSKDQTMIDKKFNKLHMQEKMLWTCQPTSFGYLVFVVWQNIQKGVKTIWKNCVVVDIWGLNKISWINAYPMSLQSDITAVVQGSQYINTVDATEFFHQWAVKAENQSKLTVVSHQVKNNIMWLWWSTKTSLSMCNNR